MAVLTYEQDSFGVALDLFEKFIQEYPESKLRPEAQLYTAQCQFQSEQFLEARDTLTRLEQSFVPFSLEDRLLFWLGRVYLRVKDYKNAAAYLRKLITAHPESALLYPAQLQLAKVFFLQGDLKGAEGVYATLLSSSKLSIREEALFERGCLFYETQDYEKAIKDFTLLSEAFLDSSRLPQAYFYLGEAYFYRNDFSKAIEYYGRALEKADSDSLKSLCFLGIGWSHLRLNNLKDAEEALSSIDDSRISDFDFDNKNLLSAKALLYLRLNDFEKALSYYEKIIAMNSSRASLVRALFGKAESLKGLSRREEAQELYTQITGYEGSVEDTETISVVAKAHYHLGEFFLAAKENGRALQEFETAAFSPGAEQAVRLSALFQLAALHEENGALAQALALYSQIRNDYSDNAYSDYVQYRLGLLSLRLGSNDAAVAFFVEFNKRYDRSDFLDDVNYYLGSAYFQAGQFSAASKQLNNFLSVFLDSAYRDDAQYLLALSLYKEGQFQNAIDCFKKALLRLDAGDELVEKIEYEIAHTLYKMGREDEAVEKLSEFIRQHPASSFLPRIMFWLGQYHYRNRHFDLSRKDFEALIRSFPHDALAFEAHYQIGLTFLAEEKNADAMRTFQHLLDSCETETQKAKAMLAIGDLFAMMGKSKEAIATYKELTQLVSSNNINEGSGSFSHDLAPHPDERSEEEAQGAGASEGPAQGPRRHRDEMVVRDDVQDGIVNESAASFVGMAFLRLGDHYKQNAQFQEALSFYSEALLFPSMESRAQIQFKIAECQEGGNNPESAQGAYSAIAYAHEEDIPWVVKGLLRSAALYEEKRDWQKAIEQYEKIGVFKAEETKFAQERIELLRKQK